MRLNIEAVTRDLRHPWSLCYQSRNGNYTGQISLRGMIETAAEMG